MQASRQLHFWCQRLCYNWIVSWSGLRAYTGFMEERKSLALAENPTKIPRPSSAQCSHYTDCVIPPLLTLISTILKKKYRPAQIISIVQMNHLIPLREKFALDCKNHAREIKTDKSERNVYSAD